MDSEDRVKQTVGTLFGESDPYSVVNALNEGLKEALYTVPKSAWQYSEHEMRKAVNPTNRDISLRISFWREYSRRCEFMRSHPKEHHPLITGLSIFVGICSESYFYQGFLRKPLKVGWMFTPMPTWRASMEYLLWRFVSRLDEIAEMQLVDPATGKVVGTNLKVFLDAYKHVEDRVVGVKTRTLMTKNLNVNKDVSSTAEEGEEIPGTDEVIESDKTPEEIEAEIAALEEGREKRSDEGQADVDQSISDVQQDVKREDSEESELRAGDDNREGSESPSFQEETYLTTVPNE